MSFLRSLFENAVKKAKSSKEIYDRLDRGIEIYLNPRSDRFTYNNPEDNNYDKDWKAKTKEEKKTLTPAGTHRIKERENVAKAMGINESNKDAYLEKQISIPSTAINAIYYDPVSEELEVQFTSSSKWYFYPAVPLEEIEALMKAPSKGEYFMKNIHDQYSMYRRDHRQKTKKEQKAIKAYKKSYKKTNKKKWAGGGGQSGGGGASGKW